MSQQHFVYEHISPPQTNTFASAINRRGFIKGSLALGFAAAVLPVTAQTIHTDSQGLIAGMIEISTANGEIPAYQARPTKGKNLGVVLVAHEIFGVHEHIRDVCRRLAKAGYCAIAPELFYRYGDVSTIKEIKNIQTQVTSKVPDAQVMSDLDACVAFAATIDGVNAQKLAITGFCWGGRITWLYAAHNQQLKAGAAWYGKLDGTVSELNPAYPLDVVPNINAPILGLYAGDDSGIPQTSVGLMQATLIAMGKPSEIIVYPKAQHAFHADYRPSYREDEAKDGWQKLLNWFKQHGV